MLPETWSSATANAPSGESPTVSISGFDIDDFRFLAGTGDPGEGRADTTIGIDPAAVVGKGEGIPDMRIDAVDTLHEPQRRSGDLGLGRIKGYCQ